jgi:methionyl-tRNA synthetase
VVLAVIANLIRMLSALFEPFMPSLSAKINFLLNLEKRTERDEVLLDYLDKGAKYDVLLTLVPTEHVINKPVVLIQEGENKLYLQLKFISHLFYLTLQ